MKPLRWMGLRTGGTEKIIPQPQSPYTPHHFNFPSDLWLISLKPLYLFCSPGYRKYLYSTSLSFSFQFYPFTPVSFSMHFSSTVPWQLLVWHWTSKCVLYCSKAVLNTYEKFKATTRCFSFLDFPEHHQSAYCFLFIHFIFNLFKLYFRVLKHR